MLRSSQMLADRVFSEARYHKFTNQCLTQFAIAIQPLIRAFRREARPLTVPRFRRTFV